MPTVNEIGEITLPDYATRGDGLVFNGNKLQAIYTKLMTAAGSSSTAYTLDNAKAAVSGSQSVITGTSTSGTTDTTIVDGVSTQNQSLDFTTMKSNLRGDPITLKFGGIGWTVVYATTNTTADGGNTKQNSLVLTLWANENLKLDNATTPTTTSIWNQHAVSDYNAAYPSNMYSTSYMRVKTLNAGGDDGKTAGNTDTSGTDKGSAYYANKNTEWKGKVPLSDRKNNIFANFTLSNDVLGTSTNKPSLTDFLTAPKNVAYQENENWVWSYRGGGGAYICPNEAWGTPDTSIKHSDGSGGWLNTNIASYANKPYYDDWAEDFLWLPSLTETGFYTSDSDWGASLWGISKKPAENGNIQYSSAASWTRSGECTSSYRSHGLSSAGARTWPNTDAEGGVRPALHLNLDMANDHAAVELQKPTAPSAKTYTGEDQKLADESWYNAAAFEDESGTYCTTTYTDLGKNEPLDSGAYPVNVGKYKVEYTLTAGSKFYWSDKKDNASLTRSVEFEIVPIELPVTFKIDTTTKLPTLTVDETKALEADKGNIQPKIRYWKHFKEDGTTYTEADRKVGDPTIDMGAEEPGKRPSKLLGQTKYGATVEFGNKNYKPATQNYLVFTNPSFTEPTPVKKPYNGQKQDVSDQTWYNQKVFDNDATGSVTYTGGNCIDVGDYTVTIELKGSDNIWAGDASNKTRSTTLSITKKVLKYNIVKDTTTGYPTVTFDEGGGPCTRTGQTEPDDLGLTLVYENKNDSTDTHEALLKDGAPTGLRGKAFYNVTAKITAGTNNYVLDPENPKSLEFENPATQVNVGWYVDENNTVSEISQEYADGNVLSFVLDIDFDIVDASYTGSGTVTIDTRYSTVKATEAGEYEIKLTLKHPDDYVWGSKMGSAVGTTGTASLKFKITPKKKQLMIRDVLNANNWEVEKGTKFKTRFKLPLLNIGEGETFPVKLYAKMGPRTEPFELCTLDLTMYDQLDDTVYELATDTLSLGTYAVIYVEASNGSQNYEFELDRTYKLYIKNADEMGGINWRLFANGSDTERSQSDSSGATVMEYTKDVIEYDGRSYHFLADVATLGEIDTSYNGGKGYLLTKEGSSTHKDAVSDAGKYVCTIKIKNSENTYSVKFEIVSKVFDLTDVEWVGDNGNIMFGQYDANSKFFTAESLQLFNDVLDVTFTFNDSTFMNRVGGFDTVTAKFSLKAGKSDKNYKVPQDGVDGSYKMAGGTAFEFEKTLTVVPCVINLNWKMDAIETSNGRVNALAIDTPYSAAFSYLTYQYYETDANGNIKDKTKPLSEPLPDPDGKVTKYYKTFVSIEEGAGYVFPDGTTEEQRYSLKFSVGQTLTEVCIAAVKTEYTYWGSAVTFLFKVTKGGVPKEAFDIRYFNAITGSKISGSIKDPGSYRAEFSLKNVGSSASTQYANNCYFASDSPRAFDFEIVPAKIKISWNENVKPPVLNVTSFEFEAIEYLYKTGDGYNTTVGFNQLTVGNYSVRAKIKDNYTDKFRFADDSTMTEWFPFTIAEGDKIVNPSDPDSPGRPSTPGGDPNGGDTDNPNQDNPGNQGYLTITLNWIAGSATTLPTFTNSENLPMSAFTVKYYLKGQEVLNPVAGEKYTIQVLLNDTNGGRTTLANSIYVIGGGAPELPGSVAVGGGTVGGASSDATFGAYLPVILSGVALVLIVVFGVMTLNYNAATKAALEKKKKLAQVAYSFSPLSLMAIVLGLSETNWWIVAGVLMGVALIMGIVAFAFHSKKRKALALLEEEEARVAEEKAYADKEQLRDDQARRDNELKMMFAAMQQNSQPQMQPQFQLDDIRCMLAETVNAILPAVQQAAALPPAQGDAEYYKRMGAETEELRKLMQQQQEQMAQQMAAQQDMINQLMQERQNVVYAPVYEEEPVDDISWLGQSEELISLEESYGNLSDEEKRCYYEIGSYIMGKPRTSQNDGRYAVLFKYRRRTLFKLCIIGDAPVLYYPSESGGRAEIRILVSNLDYAKSVIDRIIMGVDSELN